MSFIRIVRNYIIISYNIQISHLLEKYCPYDLFITLDYNEDKKEENLFLWNGQLLIKEGVYTGLNISFKIKFSNNYPNTEPEVIFNNQIFHPLIDPVLYKLDVKNIFPNWTPGKNCVIQLLFKIKDIFINPKYYSIDNSFNEECGKMFCENYIKFESIIQEDIQNINKKNENNNNINIDNNEIINEFKNIFGKEKGNICSKLEQFENHFLFKYNQEDK